MRIKFETLLYSIKIMVYTSNCVEFDFMYNQLFSIVVKGKGLWYIKKKRKIVSINGKFRHVASFLKVWGGGRLIQKNLISKKKIFSIMKFLGRGVKVFHGPKRGIHDTSLYICKFKGKKSARKSATRLKL